MSKNSDEQYLDFLRFQEVTPENTFRKSDRMFTKADEKFLKKAIKAKAKEDRKKGKR